ncbi:HAD family hydrolase [Bombilactobacillus thymidiniphilus]|uniref:HAD family phosphatase n=1 Tax=Bombilactobacillus thymidiniphilus TaxID=2923363 RepID=A0ABY4PF90_9LACO|nr:HAD family phosphatase [Bombilactobacillus thymidiniphilus]UQS84189.1 HAD family phosphatase [Bombilactobacillus thymidiniphilus]
MIKAIIFDMDGVLINSEQFYFQRRLEFLRSKQQIAGSQNFQDYVGASNQRVWQLLVPENEKLRNQLAKEYVIYQQNHPLVYPTVLNPDVKSVLCWLQKQHITVALASASSLKEVRRMLRECNLTAYFQVVLSGEEIKHNKPAPDIYWQAINKLQLPSQQCRVVEDSAIGIQAAKAANLTTWALKQNYMVDQSAADLVLPNLLAIEKYCI